ncbi:MAG: ABC transporter permease subunit [Bryobacteraceae bacterium]
MRRVLLLAVAGLLAASLVRFAPGFEMDERELTAALSDESRLALRQERDEERQVFRYYGQLLAGLLRGDWGHSRLFDRPVVELLGERGASTAWLVVSGWVIGWAAGLSAALAGILFPPRWPGGVAAFLAGAVLAFPAAILGIFFSHWGGSVTLALALVVGSRVYFYCRNLLGQAVAKPHVVAAQARGIGSARLLVWHVMAPLLPEMAALGAASFTIALGASVPIEAVCDLPGLGQLTWKAAQARDLALLVGLTWLMTAASLTANTLADLAAANSRTTA